MIGRADIEESKSNVAMNAWLPQTSYPCGNISHNSSLKYLLQAVHDELLLAHKMAQEYGHEFQSKQLRSKL